MFSLHIDTARTWRGGQNQVLLTVNGLRAIGQRAALVAHPDGELRRRAAEGLELIPIAPRTEMDLVGGLALSRASSSGSQPDVIHAHDPHGVAMASLALSLGAVGTGGRRRRWSRRAASTFTSRATRSRAGSIARSTASSPRPKRSGRCSSPTASRPTGRVTVHEGIDVEHVLAAPPVNVHEAFWLPHHAPVVGNVAALVPHKGQRLPDRGRASRRAGDARRAVRHPRRRRAARAPRAPGARAPPREARAAAGLPHRRARLHQGVRPVRDELGHRGARHVAARRDGVRDARSSATRAGGIPEVVEDGVNGAARARRAITRAWRAAIVAAAAGRRRLRQRMGDGRIRARARAVHRRADGRRDRRASTHAWPADPTQRTLRVRLRAAEAARVHHPEVAEREVVLHRIVRIERAQRRGDVARHRASPGSCSASAAGSGRRGSRACRAARSACAGETRVHTPRSSASRRTIQRRNRFSRLHALPADGRGKK